MTSCKDKYENNAKNHYLKNELSGDFSWNKQWLNEQGTHPHTMMGNLPIYTLKDNFSIMKKYGKRLVTLQSKNIMDIRPQHYMLIRWYSLLINITMKRIRT